MKSYEIYTHKTKQTKNGYYYIDECLLNDKPVSLPDKFTSTQLLRILKNLKIIPKYAKFSSYRIIKVLDGIVVNKIVRGKSKPICALWEVKKD